MKSLSSLLGVALSVGIVSAPRAESVEPREPVPPHWKPKLAIALSAPTHNDAPFVLAESLAPELDLMPHGAPRHGPARASCDSGRVLCYNTFGQMTFRPARSLMPHLPGLTRESISVKRNRIIFRYSF